MESNGAHYSQAEIHEAIQSLEQMQDRKLFCNARFCPKKRHVYPFLVYITLGFQIYTVVFTLNKYA